jgi:hypothetical protein
VPEEGRWLGSAPAQPGLSPLLKSGGEGGSGNSWAAAFELLEKAYQELPEAMGEFAYAYD